MEHSVKGSIQHSNLFSAVSELYGSQKLSETMRKELSLDISEYNIPPHMSKGLAYSLFRSLPFSKEGKSKERKLYSVISKTETLAAVEQPNLAQHISRDLSYMKLIRTLNRWSSTIQNMRNKEQLTFPLNQGTLLTNNMENITEFKSEMFTSLKKIRTEILNETPFADKGSELKEHMFNLAKLIELRKEKANLNAKYSYMLAKAARHKKIKSKKYHRMRKHKHIAYSAENLAILKKSNPIKAKRLLESIEKERAKERATLRHRNTGQWAQHVKASAKVNSQRSKQLMQQISLNYELTQKPLVASSSEAEMDEEENNNKQPVSYNPWTIDPNILEDGGSTFCNDELQLRSLSDKWGAVSECSGQQCEMLLKNSVRNKIPKNLFNDSTEIKQSVIGFKTLALKTHETLNLDKFIGMKKPTMLQLKHSHLQESSNSNCAEKSEIELITISEAFAEDDIITEFREERECFSKNSELENADSSIPGWGKWSIKCSNMPAQKLKQSSVMCHRVTPAKYANKKYKIFTEDKTDKLKEQQINQIPPSFIRIKDYEASIRYPIGNTWAPHTAHHKLVSPAIITKLGSVIRPIQNDILLKKQNI